MGGREGAKARRQPSCGALRRALTWCEGAGRAAARRWGRGGWAEQAPGQAPQLVDICRGGGARRGTQHGPQGERKPRAALVRAWSRVDVRWLDCPVRHTTLVEV